MGIPPKPPVYSNASAITCFNYADLCCILDSWGNFSSHAQKSTQHLDVQVGRITGIFQHEEIYLYMLA